MKYADLVHEIPGLEFYPQHDLRKFTTLRLRAIGDLFIVKDKGALLGLVQRFFKENLRYKVLGLGSNQALEATSDLPYIHLDFGFNPVELKEAKEEYILWASTPLNQLTTHAMKFGLKGWEVFTGIPAQLGGAIWMNAGTNLGEIGEVVLEVHYVSAEGKDCKKIIDKDSFSYRKNLFLKSGDVIYAAKLRHFGLDNELKQKIKDYLALRARTQPLRENTCGCVFKNTKTEDKLFLSGLLIDKLGLKGFWYKGFRISPVHANFIENLGDGNHQDFMEFTRIIREEVYLQYGVKLNLEVEW